MIKMDIMKIIQIIMLIVVIAFIIFLFRKERALKKVRRISYYALEPLEDTSLSFNERVINNYLSFVKNNRKFINKTIFLKRLSKNYEKFIKYKNRDKIKNSDFITHKIVIAFAVLFLNFMAQVFGFRSFNILSLIASFIIGFYVLDIGLLIYSKRENKRLSTDLLRAVIIMNNAFKAGKSTLQALKIAADELPEPISDEFKKMYLDMKYGLSVDTVFDRFAKRVGIDEAVYLSSSLTILNKTGGNIVEVFSSIEKTLFDRRKLDEELKNVVAAPKMVVRILFVIPIIFTIMIYILNPDYFNPLLHHPLGFIIIFIIIIMFIIYGTLLNKILKVEV